MLGFDYCGRVWQRVIDYRLMLYNLPLLNFVELVTLEGNIFVVAVHEVTNYNDKYDDV